jgi:hypothetical protein
MTLNKIKEMSNWDFHNLYASVVRVNHYGPCETPKFYLELQNAGISQCTLEEIVLEKMRNSTNDE